MDEIRQQPNIDHPSIDLAEDPSLVDQFWHMVMYLGESKSRQAAENNLRYREMFNATPDLVAFVDTDYRYQTVNRSYCRFWSKEIDEIVGKLIPDLLGQSIFEQTIKPRLDNCLAGERQEYQEWFTSPKYGRHFLLVTYYPVRDSAEQIIGAVVDARDITMRKEFEERIEQHSQKLAQTNKELAAFAHAASHDLKSPLRGIRQLASFVIDDLPDAPAGVKKHLNSISTRIVRMERLLNDLLEYSQFGNLNTQQHHVDIRQLLQDEWNLVAGEVGCELNLPDNLPNLETWHSPLEQVFRNIFSNALKHSDVSKCVVDVQCREHPDMLEFHVTDNGPGIAPEFAERIFDVFTTLQPRDKVEGSGLGLSLARKAVERFGGKIWLVADKENDADKKSQRGATFAFTWPKNADV